MVHDDHVAFGGVIDELLLEEVAEGVEDCWGCCGVVG